MAVDCNLSDQTVAMGIFDFREKAEAAISELQSVCFPPHAIGVMARERGGWTPEITDSLEENENSAVAGAITGAGMGAVWALGIASGVLPGIGPVVAGGILTSLLAGAVTGAAAGSILGMLIGLGLSESEARHYETAFSQGGVIVTVRAGSRFDEATRILESHGATGTRTRPIAPSPLPSAISTEALA